MAHPDKWRKLDNEELSDRLTVVSIATITGLSRRTVRGMINRYDVPALPRSRRHHPCEYLRTDLIKAIRKMVGSGNWPRKPDGGKPHQDLPPTP